MNEIIGEWPGVVSSYDAQTRTCKVKIDGLTDGANQELVAQIRMPIGDRSDKTEIEILAGDLVWLNFQRGDPRYPIIVGYRAKNVGNDVDWRRWHHKNVEVAFDSVLKLSSNGARLTLDSSGKHATIEAESITLKAGGATITMVGGVVRINGNQIRLN